MKKILILLAFFTSTVMVYSQGTCELILKNGKLSGSCENSYFTSMEIPYAGKLLDSTKLYQHLPVKGSLTINKEINLDARFEITERAGFSQVIIKSRPGWFTMDNLQILNDKIRFFIDHDPDVPVTSSDLEIIRTAKKLLGSEDSWNKNDDRNCKDDINQSSYSLFCALQTSSIKIEGEYNHRNAIMQKIRHTIVTMYPNKKWEHRLKDFNNMPETDHNTLMELLNRVEAVVIRELGNK